MQIDISVFHSCHHSCNISYLIISLSYTVIEQTLQMQAIFVGLHMKSLILLYVTVVYAKITFARNAGAGILNA